MFGNCLELVFGRGEEGGGWGGGGWFQSVLQMVAANHKKVEGYTYLLLHIRDFLSEETYLGYKIFCCCGRFCFCCLLFFEEAYFFLQLNYG